MVSPVTLEMIDEAIAALQALRARAVAGKWPPKRRERYEARSFRPTRTYATPGYRVSGADPVCNIG